MIAAAFGWPPAAMDGMSVADLMDWEQRAEKWLKARAGVSR